MHVDQRHDPPVAHGGDEMVIKLELVLPYDELRTRACVSGVLAGGIGWQEQTGGVCVPSSGRGVGMAGLTLNRRNSIAC